METKIEKYLLKLANMLKKRKSSDDFKLALRNELIRKANKLNAKKKPAKKKKKSWSFPPIFKKALAPATAAILLAVVLTSTLLPGGSSLPIELVNTAEAADYYTLTPIEEDASGIDSTAGFVLESKGEIDADEIEKALEFYPKIELTLVQEEPTRIELKPLTELDAGEIYSISLDASELSDSPYPTEYSWAYQVSDEFRITGTLPADQGTYVSINSGIEVLFNYRGVTAEDFENHFSIDPYVSGSFEVNDKTAVFMPSELDAMTIYTVTISAGLPLTNSESALTEDHTFQFETSGKTSGTTSLWLTKDMFEFDPESEPGLELYYRDSESEEEVVNVEFDIYQYTSSEDFLAAMDHKNEVNPSWTRYASQYYTSDTSGLSQVMTSDSYELSEGYYKYYLVLPDALPEGYYITQITKNDVTTEAFIQISNTAAFISISEKDSVIWVNSTETGEPIKGAEVEILNSSTSEKTDSEGIAVIDNIYEDLNSEDNSHQEFLKITADGTETFYDLNLYNSDSDEYWSILETEREYYHPTDEVYFWGFLEGRDKSVTGDAKAVIIENPWYYGYSTKLSDLRENSLIYYEEDISLTDGEAFDGTFEIEKMPTGNYILYIFQDDEPITYTRFYVEDYVKPAYEITVEAEDTVLFKEESTLVDIYTSFFEGTPVPYLDINYNADNSKNSYEHLQTDENGHTSGDYTFTPSGCTGYSCSLISTAKLWAYSFYEEEADISGGTSIFTVRSTIGAKNATADHNSLTLETLYVDEDKIATYDGYPNENGDIYSSIAPNTTIDLKITKREYEKVEDGQYYDYINKIVRTKYDYNKIETEVLNTTIYTDENGELDYDLDLDEEHTHYIDLTIYDENGNFYKDRNYAFGKKTYNSYYSSYLSLDDNGDYGKKYDTNEEFELTLSTYTDEELPEDGSYKYLYLEMQRGINDYEVSDSNTYSGSFQKGMVPNVSFLGIAFSGDYYMKSFEESITYDYEEMSLDLELESDRESYEPGDEASISVLVTDQDGDPVSADVVIYMVDEAYYALYPDTSRDPLVDIYSSVSSGLDLAYLSHEPGAEEDGGGKGGCFAAGTKILMSDGSYKNIEDITVNDQILTRKSEFDSTLVPANVLRTHETLVSEYLLINDQLKVTEEHVVFLNGQWNLAGEIRPGDFLINRDGEEVIVNSIEVIHESVMVYNFEVEHQHTYFADDYYVHNDKAGVREDFRDAALHQIIHSDASGRASVTFTLPDNITSWRTVAVAVNEDLQGGFGTTNIDVSLPVFVLPVLNQEYLTDDLASIPIRTYGTAVNQDTAVTMGIESESLGMHEQAEGTAYTQSYFDLGTLTTGEHDVISWTETAAGDDAMQSTISVTNSHFVVDTVWDEVLNTGTDVEGSETERTEVWFMNNETGLIYCALIRAASSHGDRADEVAVNRVARALLNEYFEESLYIEDLDNFLYQNDDGGIGLFPYDSSRLELTAKLAALDSSLWSEESLLNYFEQILYSAEHTLSEKILAIYGLAAMDESVLTELNYFVKYQELNSEDKIFAALAYLEFGDKASATNLYLEVLAENPEDPYTLAKLAVISAKLASDQHYIIYEEALDAYYKEDVNTDLIVLEQLMYAETALLAGAKPEVSFKLNGNKITLENTEVHKESFLPEELSDLSFSNIDGEVRVISVYEKPVDPESLSTDSSISISRSYYVDGVQTTTFSPGDLVEVKLTVTAPTEGIFRIQEYLPSGLKTTSQKSYDSDTKRPYAIDGQHLSFAVYCSNERNNCKYGYSFSYYARIINKGSFISEPAMLEQFTNPEVRALSGSRSTIIIE